jgi:hypothetical protein
LLLPSGAAKKPRLQMRVRTPVQNGFKKMDVLARRSGRHGRQRLASKAQ